MYKVAILGCENSHARTFMRQVLKNKCVDDIEFVGVYSEDEEAAQKLNAEFGVYVAKNYDEFVTKIINSEIDALNSEEGQGYIKALLDEALKKNLEMKIMKHHLYLIL